MTGHITLDFLLLQGSLHDLIDVPLHIWEHKENSFDTSMSGAQLSVDLHFKVHHMFFDALVELWTTPLNQGNDEVDDFCPFLGVHPLLLVHVPVALFLLEGGFKNVQDSPN